MKLGLNKNIRKVRLFTTFRDCTSEMNGHQNCLLLILFDLLSQRSLLSFMIPYIVYVFTNGVGFICGLGPADLMELPQSSGADRKTSLTDSRK